MEIAAGDTDGFAVLGEEDQRIVRSGIEFDLNGLASMGDGITNRTMNLRNTPQGIGILYIERIVLAEKLAALN